MLAAKTIILKMDCPDPDRLDRTVWTYTEGMNYVSAVVHNLGKPKGSAALQKIVYSALREKIGLKSQMSFNVVRQVTGTYRTLQEQVRAKKTVWQQIMYAPTSMTFSFGRDFSLDGDDIGLTTLNGRRKYRFFRYPHMEQYLDGTWKFGASKLVKHLDGTYYFHLCCERETETREVTKSSTFMGVDLGQNFLAVTSTTDRKCRFFCGGKAKDLRNVYSTMRKRLPSKGTRSAKRMLKHLSGRERRLMTDMNHRVSKEIVSFAVQNNVDVIGLEDLSGIGDRTKISKRRRYTHHSWAFFELQTFIEYKAREKGISTIYLDPAYTSQTCPRCNHISKNNRNGRSFVCECCGHSLHADLIGAQNIESRARTYRYTLEVQGCSQPPIRELSTR
ncbi:RNA-guided endonuclease TnpB family protein [Methanofollis tationis]|uniref:IS200/IS605 family element transposase accessory protein TnpB n=1 Tax=Methanofollis tationis TaxID=81417 RepID=A0A7K4HPD3_9EURY|nr:RNA-guided endonuclease TnpB family protein [Methanofollis tationis]NVO67134.1 IS200/IS605 family element transposase accessory protein TnpB [Methanofollis tationis]